MIRGEDGRRRGLPRVCDIRSGVSCRVTDTPGEVAEVPTCGPDPDAHLEAIQTYVDAGFDHVYLHQVGPDQKGFFEFARKELLPRLGARTPVPV